MPALLIFNIVLSALVVIAIVGGLAWSVASSRLSVVTSPAK
jgi:hypothetical protein